MQQINLRRCRTELRRELLPAGGTAVCSGASVGLNRDDGDPYVTESSRGHVCDPGGRKARRRIANRDVDGSHVGTLHRGISATATDDDKSSYYEKEYRQNCN